MCYQGALDTTLQEFAEKDPGEMAGYSGCSFFSGEGCIKVPYCGEDYLVEHPAGIITPLKAQVDEINQPERICILQYLCWAKGLPLRGKWLSFLELPGGEHHFAPFKNEIVLPLARKFGDDLEGFVELSRGLEQAGLPGDEGFIVPVLPYIYLAVIIWKGDEEFPSRANILFDDVSPHHLPTASLYVLGIEAVKRLYF